MSTKFECFVEIYDQRYDLIITSSMSSLKFSEIYEKIKHIVKISLKEEITYLSHQFELFDYQSNQNGVLSSSIVTGGDQLVRQKSSIRITRKIEQNPCPLPQTTFLPPNLSQPLPGINACHHYSPQKRGPTSSRRFQNNGTKVKRSRSGDQFIQREETYLLENVGRIEAYRTVVLAINIGWDLKLGSRDWQKVIDVLFTGTKTSHFNPLHAETHFHFWTEEYVKKFFQIEGKLSEKPQKIFDLLKIVHILDFEQIYDKNSSNFEQLRRISTSRAVRDYYHKYLRTIRADKMALNVWNGNVSQTDQDYRQVFDSNGSPIPQLNDRYDNCVNSRDINHRKLSFQEEELIRGERDVETYRQIVLVINIGWNLRPNERNEWRTVSNHVKESIKDRSLEPKDCIKIFFKWTNFYAKNYFKLNQRIDKKCQKIFDSLKLVHTLDLDRLYIPSDPIHRQIGEISNDSDFKNYIRKLKDIRSAKVEAKNALRNASHSPMKTLSKKVSPSVQSSRSLNNSQNKQNSSNCSKTGSSPQSKSKCLPTTTIQTEVSKLQTNESDIRDFQRICLAINLGWNFVGEDHSWKKVSKTIYGEPSKWLYCRDTFFHWTIFYSKNYDQLYGKLPISAQANFNMLRVIHTLDLFKIFKLSEINSMTSLKIEAIFRKRETKEYFFKYLSGIREQKRISEEKDSSQSDDFVSEVHRNTYDQLIRLVRNPTNSQPKSKPLPKSAPKPKQLNTNWKSDNHLSSKTSQPPIKSPQFKPQLKSPQPKPSVKLPQPKPSVKLPQPKPSVKLPQPKPSVKSPQPKPSVKFFQTPSKAPTTRPYSQVIRFKPTPKKGLSVDEYMKRKENSKNSVKSGQQNGGNSSTTKNSVSNVIQSTNNSDPRLKSAQKRPGSEANAKQKTKNDSNLNKRQKPNVIEVIELD